MDCNIDVLIQRVKRYANINRVFRQAFAIPMVMGWSKRSGFQIVSLPMKADIFSWLPGNHVPALGVNIYAWMPVLSWDLDSDINASKKLPTGEKNT
ncbi:poly-beta-1,6-N-acetyl-D-glucosamine N-deacetylase PgaB [Escherichia coli]